MRPDHGTVNAARKPRRSPRTRTVLGVVLDRTGRDTWGANGWTFQAAEGESVLGRQEWWAYDPAGKMTVETSLRGCVATMKRTALIPQSPVASLVNASPEPVGESSAPTGAFLRGDVDLLGTVLGRSAETLPTISELSMLVKAGRMNKYQAAHLAMARGHAGLCAECSRHADDERGTCETCRNTDS